MNMKKGFDINNSNVSKTKKECITFVIPSIGRQTLQNTIESIMAQTIGDWKVVIVMDGVYCPYCWEDERIRIYKIAKSGENVNHAGNVRNFGIQQVKSEWIAFLDDDDIIHPKYIETFWNEIDEKDNYVGIDVFVFRMKLGERIVPSFQQKDIVPFDVGISFLVRKSVLEKNNIKFVPDGMEDYFFLQQCKEKKCVIFLSKYVMYYVKESTIEEVDVDDFESNIVSEKISVKNKFLLMTYGLVGLLSC